LFLVGLHASFSMFWTATTDPICTHVKKRNGLGNWVNHYQLLKGVLWGLYFTLFSQYWKEIWRKINLECSIIKYKKSDFGIICAVCWNNLAHHSSCQALAPVDLQDLFTEKPTVKRWSLYTYKYLDFPQ
jgi:hypothetical protein